MKKSVVLLLAAFIVGAVACGGDDDSPAVTTLTCNRDLSDFCWSATGPEPDLVSAGYSRTTCEVNGGVIVSACSPEGRIGRCSESKGSVRVVTHLYPPTFGASYETTCLVYGTWQPN